MDTQFSNCASIFWQSRAKHYRTHPQTEQNAPANYKVVYTQASNKAPLFQCKYVLSSEVVYAREEASNPHLFFLARLSLSECLSSSRMNPNFDQPDAWANLATALVEAVDGVRAGAGVVLKDGLAVSAATARVVQGRVRQVRAAHAPPALSNSIDEARQLNKEYRFLPRNR
jgi:hypothetical protein